MAKKVLTENLSEPLNGVTVAKVDVNVADGNLMIDRLTHDEQLLASGRLQYLEGQDLPTRSVDTVNGQSMLKLSAGLTGKPWFRFPWAACNGATEWQIHLNPQVRSDITARSGGGNVKLDLTNMAVTRLTAETGGGNLDVVLPEHAANLSVTARTGAGNVTIEVGNGIQGSNIIEAGSGAGSVVVSIPGDIAARIHATTGWGKVLMDPRFSQTDQDTYQSPDFDRAVDKIEITAKSGAGNVSVNCE